MKTVGEGEAKDGAAAAAAAAYQSDVPRRKMLL